MEDDFCGTFVPDTQVLETSKNNHMEKEIDVSDEGDVGVDVATSQSPQFDRMDCLMIVVYAPQELDYKRSLWNKITSLVNNYNGMSIVLGDFNKVRCELERMGTIFSKHGASSFNEFINRAELFDIQISGRNFTRMNKYGIKLSKIDRILVSHHFISKWPNAQVLALRRELLNYCPLVLKTHSYNFGHIPLKKFNSWILNGDFPTILSLAWHNPNNTRTNIHLAIILKNKLQTLKKHLKIWCENTISRNTTRTCELKLKLDLLDTKAENNQLVDQDLFDCISFKKELDYLDHAIRLDLMQKAKFKWTLDGDENSKFFHGILNNKLSKSRIHGISLNSLFKRLFDLDISLLDSPFSCKEIKEAVWNYGGDKSSVGSIVREVQTTFIKGRQIVDGPLMVNEIITWAKNKKRRLFLLKVDFEKAFDSLDWNFLDNIMMQMNFSQKWRMWIKGCLNSGYASVLINGSPTKEFKIHKGLRQGDPLSPFLFILAVKPLHVTFLEAKDKDIFKVNFSKSKIFGVGDTVGDTNLLASILCCQPSSLPFTYLGLPIGANMNRSCNWKPIIDKFHNRLSSCKARSLSFGGRLILLKSILGALAWKQVCSSKDYSGLRIGSLHASNLAMLTKWWWRMYALETYKECLIFEGCVSGGLIDLSSHVWTWRRSPRDGIEKAQFDDLVNILVGPKPSDVRDTWTCSLNSINTFTVSSMRFVIDSSILVSTIDNVKWNKTLPIKINNHS
uniref:RNA-directed DNA polymerase, eukaryota, reverse transcriptase zinc-binding domain protein n=1 Tax=Tanacetum cinerariifolium TaxID=118510 RepID=A0A6L2J7X7_TANCI|nr:RNA-directed DNA polymerase, eukaryota, reverse transcriptase zinc-binding domain protein [Tanacetum cinerariifolium]